MNRLGWVELRPRLRLREHMAAKFDALGAAEKSSLVARAFASTDVPPPSGLTRCEKEALDTAITMFRRGAAGGGKIGFRAEQDYIHQYGDLAEELESLRARLGASS
jgi:hypothetical protein